MPDPQPERITHANGGTIGYVIARTEPGTTAYRYWSPYGWIHVAERALRYQFAMDAQETIDRDKALAAAGARVLPHTFNDDTVRDPTAKTDYDPFHAKSS